MTSEPETNSETVQDVDKVTVWWTSSSAKCPWWNCAASLPHVILLWPNMCVWQGDEGSNNLILVTGQVLHWREPLTGSTSVHKWVKTKFRGEFTDHFGLWVLVFRFPCDSFFSLLWTKATRIQRFFPPEATAANHLPPSETSPSSLTASINLKHPTQLLLWWLHSWSCPSWYF